MNEIKVKWIKGLIVEGEALHKSIRFDTRHKDHNELEGSSPTDVFLMSIISCSTMAAVASLDSNNVLFKGVEAVIEVDTESSIDTPYQFTRFRIKYFFQEVDIEQEASLIEAVQLSHTKYCSMIFMAEKIAPVQYEIINSDVSIHKSSNWKENSVAKCESEICDIYYAY